MMFTEDFSAFFRESEMASSVTVDGVSRTAIFDNGYAQESFGALSAASAEPSIILPSTQVPASPVGKTVIANAVTYTITGTEPDGTGLTTLRLRQ